MSVARLLFVLSFVAAPTAGAQGAGKGSPADDPRVARADLARIQGSSSAKLWMLMISDFECPYCKDFHDKTAKALLKEYVATGKMRFAYLHLPLVSTHANALPAAEASMCAGAQDKFWPYHDRLFADVMTWGPSMKPDPLFVGMARDLKLDVAAFEKCLADDVMLPMIQLDRQRAAQSGARSTPTFLIGSRLVSGNAPLNVLRSTINTELARAR